MICPKCGAGFQFLQSKPCSNCGITYAMAADKLNQEHFGFEPTLPSRASVLADPSASFWLKAALRSSEQRDVVDAMNDADLLFEILKREADEVAAQQRTKR